MNSKLNQKPKETFWLLIKSFSTIPLIIGCLWITICLSLLKLGLIDNEKYNYLGNLSIYIVIASCVISIYFFFLRKNK